MGCGASSPQPGGGGGGPRGTAPLTAPPKPKGANEEVPLEYISLKKTQIYDYDGYFEIFEATINNLVEMINDAHDEMNEIQDAAGTLLGALKLSVLSEVRGHAIRSTDAVLISIISAETYMQPPPSEVAQLLQNPAVVRADRAIANALELLGTALASAGYYVSLSVNEFLEVTSDDRRMNLELAALNQAVKVLQGTVGPGYKLKVVVIPTKAFGVPTFCFVLYKLVFVDFDTEPMMRRATPLEIASCREARALVANISVATQQAAAIAAAASSLSFAALRVKKKRRLVIRMATARDDDDDGEARLEAYRRAIADANLALYRIWRATLALDDGDVTIVAAFKAMLQNLVAYMKTTDEEAAGKTLKELLQINPLVEAKEGGGIDFWFGIRPRLEDFVWPDCLPRTGLKVYDAVNLALDRVEQLVGDFPSVKEDVSKLVEGTNTVFENPREKVMLAGLDRGAAANAMAAVSSNISIIAGSMKLLQLFRDSVTSLAEELNKSAAEMRHMAA